MIIGFLNSMDHPKTWRVFQHQITPGMVNENDLEVLFPPNRFTLLCISPSHIQTAHILLTGEATKVPTFYAIFRRPQDSAS